MTRTALSDHEWCLLQALDTGAGNRELGILFGRSEYTIRNQLSALYKKIGAANRVHAVTWFRTHAPRSVLMTNRATADRRQDANKDRRNRSRPKDRQRFLLPHLIVIHSPEMGLLLQNRYICTES